MAYGGGCSKSSMPREWGDWQTRAKDILASQGNTIGFPQQFHWPERKHHGNYSSPEYVNIHINDERGIPSVDRSRPLPGDYRSMVEDFPFDPSYDEKQNLRLSMWGLGLIGLGAFLF